MNPGECGGMSPRCEQRFFECEGSEKPRGKAAPAKGDESQCGSEPTWTEHEGALCLSSLSNDECVGRFRQRFP